MIDEIVTQGETGDAYYVVASGRLAVFEDGAQRRELGRGAAFGERALVGDGRRTATVRAVTPARLYRLDRVGFETLLAASFTDAPRAGPSRVPTARAH